MEFQFVIPLSHSDLLHSVGDNYYVKYLYNANEIPEQLKNCKQSLMKGDPFYIFDDFDIYYAVIENASSLASCNLTRSFDLLYLTMDKLGNDLFKFFNTTEHTEGKDRNSYLNLTKMTVYLFVNIVKCIEQTVYQNQSKKAKKTDVLETTIPDWEQKKFKFLAQIYNIIQISIEKLWNPPVAEENFVNLVCDICYRILENHNSKEKQIGDTIFQILGIAIKRYNHALTFPVKMLQILRNSETSAPTIANGIYILAEEYGITSVFGILIKDIIEAISIDSSDTAITRNFSNFLIELGNVSPKLMIPHLSQLGDELLNCESHVLRICALQIMGDTIVSELTSEELSDESKAIRDEFLENLLAHLNDVSAHVRSKVLQIWNHLKEENAVPLLFQHKVLIETVERLDDRTSTVRKCAVILIKSFLESNPFSATLSLTELIKKYEVESEKMEKLQEIIDEERKKAEILDEQWEFIIPDIFPYVEECLKQLPQNEIDDQTCYEKIVQNISSLLLEKKYKEAITLTMKADLITGNSELRLTLKFEEQCAYYMALLKSYMFIANGARDSVEEYGTQIKTVQFLEDSIKFSKIIAKAVPKIQNMLQSKINTDVFESVNFFTAGYMFSIKGTEEGMRKMLYLVWSSDKEKRDAVCNAYKKVLFTTDLTGRAHALKVVQNLSSFLEDLTYGHFTAFETLVKEWVLTDDIDLLMIQILFELFTMKLEGTTENESRKALQLLIMCSSAKSTIASANLPIIENIGFGDRGIKDSRIFTGCLEFYLNSVDASIISKYYTRYDKDLPLLQKIRAMFIKFFFHPFTTKFDDIATKIIEFIYHLCQEPDIICQNLIIELHQKLKELLQKITDLNLAEEDALETPQDSPTTEVLESQTEIPTSQDIIPPTQVTNKTKMCLPVFLISRFIFTIGFMTMKEMIFLDINVYNNMKWRQELAEEKKNAKKKGILYNKRKTLNLDISASGSLKRLSCNAAEPQQEPDEDLVGATAEDSIAELINHICEDVLVYNNQGVLHKLIPFVLTVCKYPSRYKDDDLQQAATLALIRFMSVSSKFCEEHMPFLMNILALTKNVKIKCNIIIGLSDLTFRFPNIIEPWTAHFYSTLHETNDDIRITAVKMLSHLVLHEMIRVKGNIADLALCIVDENDEIKNMTMQFFKEIANKSNILYNVLPDIISKLSDLNLNLEEEKYHIIMRYILGLIQKDRQVETLVEKLCFRFQVTTEERQWRDISYCLSLLNYNEKSIKKLIDNIQLFKDKVQVDEVYQSFKLIITTTNKTAKPDLKTTVAEFETRLNECLEVREIADEADSEDSHNRQPVKTQTNKKKNTVKRKKSNRQKKQRSSQSEELSSSSAFTDSSEDEFVSQSKPGNNHPRTQPRIATSKKITKVINDTESSEEDDVPQRKKGKNKK